jgi:hypothetical protein
METKYLTMAIRALRAMDHPDAPDWADKAEDELKALVAEKTPVELIDIGDGLKAHPAILAAILPDDA